MSLPFRLRVQRHINDLLDLRLRDRGLAPSSGAHLAQLRQTLRLEPGTPSSGGNPAAEQVLACGLHKGQRSAQIVDGIRWQVDGRDVHEP